MLNPDSLMSIAFRYARWLRETEQWEAMDLFSAVIHPALGRLAGMGKIKVTDLTPAIVRRTVLIARQDRIDDENALGAWIDFCDYLDAEGVVYPTALLDQVS
jgi:hypothetical protein